MDISLATRICPELRKPGRIKPRSMLPKTPRKIDPLEPFMVFGMPQSEQILYKTLIQDTNAKPDGSADCKSRRCRARWIAIPSISRSI